MTIDENMYGSIDMEAEVQNMVNTTQNDPAAMALFALALIALAKQDAYRDPLSAIQTLNRLQFLILRCCPMLNPDRAEDEIPLPSPTHDYVAPLVH